MKCLLCGFEADQNDMHHLIFSIQNRREFERRFPEGDLDARIRNVGICGNCMFVPNGRHRTLTLAANVIMQDEAKPTRVLHLAGARTNSCLV